MEAFPAVAEVVSRRRRLVILIGNAGVGPADPAEAVTEVDLDVSLVDGGWTAR